MGGDASYAEPVVGVELICVVVVNVGSSSNTLQGFSGYEITEAAWAYSCIRRVAGVCTRGYSSAIRGIPGNLVGAFETDAFDVRGVTAFMA